MHGKQTRCAFRSLGFFLAALWLVGVAARADPITITFDDLPAGSLSELDYTTVRVHFSSFDPVFVNGGVSVRLSSSAHTSPNAAFGNGALTVFGAARNISVELRGVGVTPPFTDLFSFRVVGTQPGQLDPWRAVAGFGGVEHVFTGTTDTLIVFSSSSFNIQGFRFYPSSSYEGIDTISFNAHPVPEPTTLILLGTGLAGMTVRARRRRRGRKGG
jgi:hypothetical protein